MYSTASLTVRIFSASSSGISISNASSKAMTSSTVSRESAPKSSTKEAVAVTSPSSTPNCSTIICFTFSSTAAILLLAATHLNAPRAKNRHSELFRCLCVLSDISDCVLHGINLLRVLVGYFDIKCFLESHNQFHAIEGVSTQIVHEGCRRG